MIDDMLNIVMDPLFSQGANDNAGYANRTDKYKSNYALGPEVFQFRQWVARRRSRFKKKKSIWDTKMMKICGITFSLWILILNFYN